MKKYARHKDNLTDIQVLVGTMNKAFSDGQTKSITDDQGVWEKP